MAQSEKRTSVVSGFNEVESVPVKYDKRSCTDVCCLVIGLLFTVVLIVLAIVLYNPTTYLKSSMPADSDGKLCGVDFPQYPIVYFAKPTEIAKRVCVSKCPSSGDDKLLCSPTETMGCRFSNTPGFENTYYDNSLVANRNGMFCMPTDESQKNQLLEATGLKSRDTIINSLDTIKLCLLIAIALSLIYFVLVQCLPRVMNKASVILGVIILVGLIVCSVLYTTTNSTAKIAITIGLVVLLIIIVITVCKNFDSWEMHGVFLDYSTKFLCDNLPVLAYIPLFLLFLAGFLVLLVWEFKSFWATGELEFKPEESLYHNFKGAQSIIMSVFLIIQAIWGLTFIKQAFNFCIAGNAVLWYYGKSDCCEPFKLLWCKHLGSVIAGSFMTAFFSIFDFIFDFIKPDDNADPDGCYTSCYQSVCCCASIFDLVRSDAMAFINLTGNPYCNSSRYCEYLCNQSIIMDYSQSTSRAYRICAHILISGICAIASLYLKGEISLVAMGVVVVLTLFISTLFISLHADATQAIQIVFLEDEEFSKRKHNRDSIFDPSDVKMALGGQAMQKDLAREVQRVRSEQIDEKEKKAFERAEKKRAEEGRG